ncbi:diguanylate cyclase [Synechococcus sp. CS-1328]|uniref:sensor domain-containing diguanylate cyclase n=1 Tax=Synechococcus sp. CS-1328 TaxID=2847976 RepID=UPI00223AEE99|nr:diguanylate cyclase [Synechococcus sp. CS-1328]MCT0226155.1 diguanylate cyclase [Synechococcus sp. CS-1328]
MNHGSSTTADPSPDAGADRPIPIPPDETGRLQALRHYQILDQPPSEAFDQITQLTSQLFGVPIAVISLVDEDRQWFLSRTGLEARQTDRQVAFCAHAICEADGLVVEDASLDERFRDNPLVRDDPSIRFYAGALLTTADGHNLGTLCVIDRKPRQFKAAERTLLRNLAQMVMEQLEQHRRQVETLPEHERQLFQFLRTGSNEFERSRRFQRPLSLLQLSLSQPLLQEALRRQVVASLQQELRDHDRVASPAADQFCVLLIETDANEAGPVGERLRGLVSTAVTPTVAATMATITAADHNFNELWDRSLVLLSQEPEAAPPEPVAEPAVAGSAPVQSSLQSLARVMARQVDPASGTHQQGPRAVLGRQGFFDAGQHEYERARRFCRPLSLLLLDLDHMALLNEQWGRASGDSVIATVAQLIREELRDQDLLSQLGGDSFGVLMMETGAQGAAQLAERIRECIASNNFHASGLPIFVTASGGFTSIADTDTGFADLFSRAEASLTLAKQTGRNRIKLNGRPSSRVERWR